VELSDPQIRILSAFRDVEPYVHSVCVAADADPSALGFLPRTVYVDAAEQERLLIATIVKDGNREYAGHLFFGFVFPYARIFQSFVLPEFRLRGVGRKLVEALISRAEKLQFLSVRASVAEDLGANGFWEQLGFNLIRTKTGKGKNKRPINIRIRELATPSLLELMGSPSVLQTTDLTFIDRFSGPSPIYAIDLNVLFDVTKKRPRAADAGRVIWAGFNNLVRLAVTEEFILELRRTSVPAPTDPILALAANLPILSAPRTAQLQATIATLATLIFPDRNRTDALSQQDQSDLAHLAIAIYNKVAGFITGEKAILRSRERLRSDFALDVVSVSEFAGMVESPEIGEPSDVKVTSCGAVISAKDAEQPEDADIRSLLSIVQPAANLATEALGTEPGIAKRRVLVFCDAQAVALGCWEVATALRPQTQAFVFADEDHGAVESAIDFLLDRIGQESLHGISTLTHLRLPSGHVATTRLALGHGYTPVASNSRGSGEFRKLSIGRTINVSTWDVFIKQVKEVFGLGFPKTMPEYSYSGQVINLTNSADLTLTIPLIKLENLLSPVLFLLPGRPGALVPIRRRYVDELLGGCPQLSFLQPPEARLLHERVYFSSSRNQKILTEGTPILFYESAHDGGRASVIALARIVRTERVLKDAVNPKHTRRGVFDTKNLQSLTKTSTLAATTFDNIFRFRDPVPLNRLRQIGCRNFRTAQPISHEKLLIIVQEGIAL
jgi:GNAT superfamily N-acetyltransferase